MGTDTARLKIGEDPEVEVADEHHLRILLQHLNGLADGEVASLGRDRSDYIKATRHGALWSVTAKRGNMWTAQSFTAGMTTDYSERRAQKSRQTDSLGSRLMSWVRSPPPERALNTRQVETVFSEYLLGQKFTIPFSGA